MNGLSPLSLQNSSFTLYMLAWSPLLQCQLKPEPSSGSSSPSPSPSFYGTNIVLGLTLMFSMTNLRQSRFKLIGVCLGWTGSYSIGISIDSTSPVPTPFEMAWMSFLWVGLLVLSIPKMYYWLSGGFSKMYLTIRARSFTWTVGTLFLPSPIIGSFSGLCFHAFSKWLLKIASPRPYRTPAEMT